MCQAAEQLGMHLHDEWLAGGVARLLAIIYHLGCAGCAASSQPSPAATGAETTWPSAATKSASLGGLSLNGSPVAGAREADIKWVGGRYVAGQPPSQTTSYEAVGSDPFKSPGFTNLAAAQRAAYLLGCSIEDLTAAIFCADWLSGASSGCTGDKRRARQNPFATDAASSGLPDREASSPLSRRPVSLLEGFVNGLYQLTINLVINLINR
ncbi:unnamed protein product [Protopolystoma xenopodis]|uniref:Uncharacterized protein n=1 Tax=Protopolystoma xenopodis TaxID=117903 RepID=A0A448WPZ4_9PLAT|nr:unnamed protein product [Protopolystoma xenopodis]